MIEATNWQEKLFRVNSMEENELWLIERIQLDAFKAGARWAAKIALKSFEHLDNDFNLAGKVISGDLEMASSNLKEIPK